MGLCLIRSPFHRAISRTYDRAIRWYTVESLHPHLAPPLPDDFDATKYRQWVQISPEKNSKESFSVMLYNLLLQHYLWVPVFGYLDQRYLDWQKYRLPLINASLRQFKCDIMFFQEMESQVYERHWRPNFPNYDTIYIRKTPPNYWGRQPKEFLDGVGIFINSKRFQIEKSNPFLISRFIEERPSIFKMSKDLQERVLSRNTVAIVAKLRDLVSGKTLYVTNSHLYWNPKFNDVKVLQTKAILTALNEIIDPEDRGKANIVVGGDLNSTPALDVYSLLDGGQVDTTKLKCFTGTDYGIGSVKNPFKLSTAYEKLLSGEDDYEASQNGKLQFTAFTKALTAILDHIWYSSDNIKVNKILGEVNSDYCNRDDVIGFPNRQFPSDHIPLVAQLEYKS